MGSALSACSVARRFLQRLAQRLSFRKGEEKGVESQFHRGGTAVTPFTPATVAIASYADEECEHTEVVLLEVTDEVARVPNDSPSDFNSPTVLLKSGKCAGNR